MTLNVTIICHQLRRVWLLHPIPCLNLIDSLMYLYLPICIYFHGWSLCLSWAHIFLVYMWKYRNRMQSKYHYTAKYIDECFISINFSWQKTYLFRCLQQILQFGSLYTPIVKQMELSEWLIYIFLNVIYYRDNSIVDRIYKRFAGFMC